MNKLIVMLAGFAFVLSAQEREAVTWKPRKISAGKVAYMRPDCYVVADTGKKTVEGDAVKKDYKRGDRTGRLVLSFRVQPDGKGDYELLQRFSFASRDPLSGATYIDRVPEDLAPPVFQEVCGVAAKKLPPETRALFRGYLGVE